MARKTLIDLKLETLKEWEKYYKNTRFYLEKIKAIVKKHDESAKIILFGSQVKGTMKPDSDIDVLIVSKLAKKQGDRLKIRIEIAKEIGDSTPFEIHIVTQEEYEKWYKKFIDKYYIEI